MVQEVSQLIKIKKNLYKSNFIYFLKQSNFMYGSLSLKKKKNKIKFMYGGVQRI